MPPYSPANRAFHPLGPRNDAGRPTMAGKGVLGSQQAAGRGKSSRGIGIGVGVKGAKRMR